MKRREFITKTLTAGAAIAALPILPALSGEAPQTPISTQKSTPSPSKFTADELQARYEKLDEALRRPIFRKELFPDPVIIDTLELLELDGRYLCRVRSKDGAEGISVGHGSTGPFARIMRGQVIPFFIGQDARELDALVEWIFMYRLNFRLNGMAIGLPLATIEFAIIDMMGKISGKSAADLIGGMRNPEIGLYYATELRQLPLDEHFRRIQEEVSEFDVRALKIKVGFMWDGNRDIHYKGIPGKSEKLIPMVRDRYPDWALYADANGYYSADEAIRIGRILEEHRFGYFEEPVFFDNFEEVKKVADALSIPIANGEQDQNFYNYRWLLAHDGLDIVEPDAYYFGGFIRSMRVALMADAVGKKCLTHMSGGSLGYLYNSLLVSALPNPTPHHEFKGFGTHVPFECPTSPLTLNASMMKVPTGPGLGVTIDPTYIAKYKPINN
ncbi:MAG: mandelate racemase/muconate lactonizing enzyme family protein [Alistipes sp.]|jgi:L-alanine-DL-glutamate epimerase-like enolase superfamily enzyme|nr:mandelate racemase/muconate lactonizing enzyme family protein [Alistipes sp.]